GTITRTGAVGRAVSFNIGFDNAGTVNIGPGDLHPGPSATSDTGTYNITNGANLVLDNGDRKFAATGVVNGPGRLFVNGNVILASQTLSNLAIVNGTVTGPFTASGAFTWSGGVLDGATTTTVSNTATLTLNGAVQGRHGKTLALNGTTVWNDGDFCLGEASKLNNAGTLNIFANFGRQIFNCSGAPPVVKNLAGAVLN